jgi:hypothetical protein
MSTDTPTVVNKYWEKYNIPVVTVHQAKRNLVHTLKYGQKRGVIALIGDAGIGKSQVVDQAVAEAGFDLVDIRTSSFTLLSAGVPQRADPVTGAFEIAVPSVMPREGDPRPKVVFFDELNQGQPHALNMFFSLMEDRCLFNYRLPDSAIIVAAYNPASSNYNVSKIENLAAFNRRMMKFYVVSDSSEFFMHAQTPRFHKKLELPCHPLVLGYIRAKRTMLYDNNSRDKGQQFACPATWETVSETLHVMDREKINYQSRDGGLWLEGRLGASIGCLTASDFMSYARDTDSLIDPLDVLTKYTTDTTLRTKIATMMSNPEGRGHEHVESVCIALFEHIPDRKTTSGQAQFELYGRNMLKWWVSHTPDTQQKVYQSFKEQLTRVPGQESLRRTYIFDLTRWWARTFPEYTEMDKALQESRREHDAENDVKQ